MIDTVTVEQKGPVRAVIKVTGTHGRGDQGWLPFTLRFYLFAGSDGIRLVHSFVYDGDPQSLFITGLGVEFLVPMRGEPHSRHVGLAALGPAVLGEPMRSNTGLRLDRGEEAVAAQTAGQAAPDPTTWDERVTSRLHWSPAWGEYSLRQLNANGFEIHKRT